MKLFEAIKKRYSCRSYLDKPIEKDKLEKIIEAARLAPSAKNFQDWRFVFVTDPAKKEQLAHAANGQMFLAKASVIIVACSNKDYVMSCGQASGPIDVAIAMEHIALTATSLGLATCWIGAFNPDKVKPVVQIPKDIEIIELMALGYPADKERHNSRLAAEQIVSFDQWGFLAFDISPNLG